MSQPASELHLSALLRRQTRPGHGPGRPRLRLVAPARQPGRYALAFVALAAIGVFGVVSLNALAAEAAFEARSLENEVHELSLRYDELTASVAALESPERVRDVAVNELGMTPAGEPGFLVLSDGLESPRDATRPAIEAAILTEDALADSVKQIMSPPASEVGE